MMAGWRRRRGRDAVPPGRPAAGAVASRVRPSVRLRLALLCAGLVVLAGATGLGMTYLLVSNPVVISVRRVGVAEPGKASSTGGPVGVFIGRGAPPPSLQQLLSTLKAEAAKGIAPYSSRPGAVQFVERVSSAQHAFDLRQLLLQGGMALALLAILALGLGWWVAGRMVRPLQTMTRRVRQLSAQTPLGRIGLRGPNDELKDLADTFDGLLARLDAALAAERRFVANASHELRTPLAIQETLLDVGLADPAADAQSLREMAGRLRQVNRRSKQLIEGLLVLARSEQELVRREVVDLAAVARDAVEAIGPEAAGRGVRVTLDARPAPVRGDVALLDRLAGNLVENAVRHNVDGGWVRVVTAATDDSATLTVENGGPVIAHADVGDLFQPFRRGARERTDSQRGAGLGLSIVQAVVTAHGGRIRADARPDGGLTVEIALPTTGRGA